MRHCGSITSEFAALCRARLPQLRVLRDVARNLVNDIDAFEAALRELQNHASNAPETPPAVVVDPEPRERIMRIADVSRQLGLCRSTICRVMQMKRFPGQVHLSEHAVGWRTSDIDAWLTTREAPTGGRQHRNGEPQNR